MLRAFAVDGQRCVVIPGGLTRVFQFLTSLIVTMQHGGVSKNARVLGRSNPSMLNRIDLEEEDEDSVSLPPLSNYLPSLN